MQAKRIIQHGVIAAYGFVTLCAFAYTMTRADVWLPRQVLVFFSSMMSPYQGDGPWHYALVAEGLLPDGQWETIDLDPYYPYGRAERLARSNLATYHKLLGDELRTQKFTELALRLLVHERQKGKPYEVVRLIQQRWDRSPGGHEFLRAEPMLASRILAEVR